MTDCKPYQCFAYGYPVATVDASTGFEARKAYARSLGMPDTRDVMSRRCDMVDANWRKMVTR